MSTQLDERPVTVEKPTSTRPPKNHIFCIKCNNNPPKNTPYVGLTMCGITAPANGHRLRRGQKPPNPCRKCVLMDRFHRHSV